MIQCPKQFVRFGELIVGCTEELRTLSCLFGHALNFELLAVKFDEDSDLCTKDLRLERLEEIIDGSERISAKHIFVAGIDRGEKNDRRVLGSGLAANERGRFEAIHYWHL